MNTESLTPEEKHARLGAMYGAGPNAFKAAVEAPKAASTQTLLTRGAIKKYALAVSTAKRAGKFTRVGESFIIGVEAELESKLRALGTEIGGQVPVGSIRFINGTTKRKAAERLELAVAQIIHGKVMRHPSVGLTLKD